MNTPTLTVPDNEHLIDEFKKIGLDFRSLLGDYLLNAGIDQAWVRNGINAFVRQCIVNENGTLAFEIKDLIRSIVREEIAKSLALSTPNAIVEPMQKRIADFVYGEIRNQIADHLHVDMKITLVEPPNGVSRNIVGDLPEVREEREA